MLQIIISRYESNRVQHIKNSINFLLAILVKLWMLVNQTKPFFQQEELFS